MRPIKVNLVYKKRNYILKRYVVDSHYKYKNFVNEYI